MSRSFNTEAMRGQRFDGILLKNQFTQKFRTQHLTISRLNVPFTNFGRTNLLNPLFCKVKASCRLSYGQIFIEIDQSSIASLLDSISYASNLDSIIRRGWPSETWKSDSGNPIVGLDDVLLGKTANLDSNDSI